MKKKVGNEAASSDEFFTTESFLFYCKQVGLTSEDMQVMDIGDCLDYIQEWIDHNDPKKEKKRKATQADFDSF
ncbi:hypothetical protein B4X80_15815 [Listeria monocytogenes]|nr:hypothetical protein [Listeria monocytogenes]EAC2325711.1 hypothetical protein [Listeria monocytogenes]EAC2672997.1 hypothetical protein [Listeria monocytogenes]EAC3854986.1 hypothetical protein [Listeria monocytogenes]EAC3864540.1 hypothetical protein [Listeria monocytogenes]